MTNILIRPILTEKALKLSEEKNQYVFEVHHEAKKRRYQKSGRRKVWRESRVCAHSVH